MGRPSLGAAVASVVMQDFQDWELLVVNASGVPFEDAQKSMLGSTGRLMEPGRRLNRGEAANALLDAARGTYAIFLDDDDLFLQGHLAKLASRLETQTDVIAAYSDTQCILASGSDGQERTHWIARDFDAVALQVQNFLPIHSVLFRTDALARHPVCRFDSTLELFEDWDFWLQLSAKGAFVRCAGASAVYHLDAGAGSGHAQAGNLKREQMLQRLGARQLARWSPSDVARLIERDSNQTTAMEQLRQQKSEEHDRLIAQLDHAAEAHAQAASALRQEISELQLEVNRITLYSREQGRELQLLASLRVELLGKLDSLNGQLDALHASRSWRLTRPLRAIGRRLRKVRGLLQSGLGNRLIRAARSEISRFGVAGVLKRLPGYWMNRHYYLSVMQSRPATGQPDLFTSEPGRLRDMRLHPDIGGETAAVNATVSVVIPTLNAGAEFAWMLRKLKMQQGLQNIEIVVVDSGSTDATVQIARQYDARVIEILPSEFSHSYARNLGAEHATGEYLLFMVQDAYPIGDHWMLGMVRYLKEHAPSGLAALSCAEYSRSDSDMMYDSMINTHYKFLGCLDFDRIGEHIGDDHMSLRSRGQLSDVSCLIGREFFEAYRYRGNYAEDLDLGIRLIKDGKKVAMLAHIKVIHSHNRPAYYYLKRSFVDVIFLVGLFDDFSYPRCTSFDGLVIGALMTAGLSAQWILELDAGQAPEDLGACLSRWIASARSSDTLPEIASAEVSGDARVDAFLMSLHQDLPTGIMTNMPVLARTEALRFRDSFLGRLEHFAQFSSEVYGKQDQLLKHQLAEVVRKTYAATLGATLAFYCLDHQKLTDDEYAKADRIRQNLSAGV